MACLVHNLRMIISPAVVVCKHISLTIHDFLWPVVTGRGHPWMPHNLLCFRCCRACWRTPFSRELLWIKDVSYGKWSRLLCYPWTISVARIRAFFLVFILRKFLRIFVLARDKRFNAKTSIRLHNFTKVLLFLSLLSGAFTPNTPGTVQCTARL